MDYFAWGVIALLLAVGAFWLGRTRSAGTSVTEVAEAEPPLEQARTPKADTTKVEESPAPAESVLIVGVGTSPDAALIRIEEVEASGDFKNAQPLGQAAIGVASRMNALVQAVPSVAAAGNMAGRRIMEVVVNGELVSAADGNGLRGFVMGADGIQEQARLFEAADVGNLVNAAAVWQIASVIVAQKHLADISEKLSEIKDGVDHISDFLDAERRSRMKAIADYLAEVLPAVSAGELADSTRNQLEACEVDLKAAYEHLLYEYEKQLTKEVEKDTAGTETEANNLTAKLDTLRRLERDIEFCVKARLLAFYVLSFFQGEKHLKDSRLKGIRNSMVACLSASESLERKFSEDISALNSMWNLEKTLNERKAKLRELAEAARLGMENIYDHGHEGVAHLKSVLKETQAPARLYLEYEDGNLLQVRQARGVPRKQRA